MLTTTRPAFRLVASLIFIVVSMLLTELTSTQAADGPTLRIDGAVATPLTLTVADLAALPQSDVHVAYLTGHGPEEATYSGVALWSLLEKAGFGEAFNDKKTKLSHVLIFTASDGYQIALSYGELEPNLEGKSAIIALKRNGQPIDDKDIFRLALPGDKHGARNMHLITHIELK